jgi:pimeloyl-ACP methyl ester carboxylesterase
MAAVVLVHGAWHGAWCWDRVVPGLAGQGIRTVAIDLPGHGADSGPLVDLHGDAARVREVLDDVGEPVVLVGHSYGGAVITEAGEHPMVDHLVYISAFALDADESCISAAVSGSEAVGISWEGRPNLAEGFVSGPDETITLDPTIAAACLYNDCDDVSIAWALLRLGPHPLANLQQEPTEVAWRTKPSTYVVCTEDLVIHPDLQRVLTRRCTSSAEWPTSHSPFLSRPQLVVDLLGKLASANE